MALSSLKASQDSAATEPLSQEVLEEADGVKLLDIVPTATEMEFTRRSLAQRPFPPLSAVDTICVPAGMPLESEHGIGKIFEDHEIVCIFPPIETEVIGHRFDFRQQIEVPIEAHMTRIGNWVLRQQGQRGCTAACNMLRKDKGKAVDLVSLLQWNCRKIELAVQNLRQAGFHVVTSPYAKRDLAYLASRVQQVGSALVTLHGKDFGAHVVIIDQIGETNTLVREPYHGWQLLVKNEALKHYLYADEAFQIID